MNKVQLYIADSWNELKNKVTWPTWQELQSSALVVAIAALIIAMTVFAMDTVANGLMTFFYKTF